MLLRRALLTASRPARAEVPAKSAGTTSGPEIYNIDRTGGPLWGRHGALRYLWRSEATEPYGRDNSAKANPISGKFPHRHSSLCGDHVYPGSGPYSIMRLLSGKNPVRYDVPFYLPETTFGGVVRRTIDPVRHMSTQDRYETVGIAKMAEFFLLELWQFRGMFVAMTGPALGFLFLVWLEQRREPLETYVDRDEYWKNQESWYYGLAFDHHHYSHMLAVRRANKWGYHDVTLDAPGHH